MKIIRLSVSEHVCRFRSKIRQNFEQPVGQEVTWCYESEWLTPAIKAAILAKEITPGTPALLGWVESVNSCDFLSTRRAEITRIRTYRCPEDHIACYRFDLRLGASHEETFQVTRGVLASTEDFDL